MHLSTVISTFGCDHISRQKKNQANKITRKKTVLGLVFVDQADTSFLLMMILENVQNHKTTTTTGRNKEIYFIKK